MISDPNLIYYACIAKGTIIIAEFNSKDADLGLIALKCLDKTPSLHKVFSHTVRNRTYLFLIHHPYSYFAIFDENLDNLEGLAFLKSVKDAFENIDDSGGGGRRSLESLSSHCFQGEFNPVFRQLLASHDDDMDGLRSPPNSGGGHKREESSDYSRGGGGGLCGSVADGKPLLLGDAVNCLKKKKRFLLGDCVKGGCSDGKPKGNDGMNRNRKGGGGSEASDEMAIRLSRDFSSSSGSVSTHHKNGVGGGLYCSGETAGGGQKRGNKVWRRHVWVVLSMDLIICVILFVVWLCICRGFKCVY